MNQNITLLTWEKLYSYIKKNGKLPVFIYLFPTNRLGQFAESTRVRIIKYYAKSLTVGLFLELETDEDDDYLWVQRLYPYEMVKGKIHDEFYKYFYFIPDIRPRQPLTTRRLTIDPTRIPNQSDAPKKTPRRRRVLPTIYQKPIFDPKPNHYDFYQDLQQQTQHHKGNAVRVLIICGLEAYIKKKTTMWIKRLYPERKLEIINTGSAGQHYFTLGISPWPQSIKGNFDLIVLEFCPIDIYNYANLHILYERLKEKGFVLFLYKNHRLFSKSAFLNFIIKNRQKTLTFQILDS